MKGKESTVAPIRGRRNESVKQKAAAPRKTKKSKIKKNALVRAYKRFEHIKIQ